VKLQIPDSSLDYSESQETFSNDISNTKVSISDESIPLESSIDSKKLLEAEISEEAKKMSLPESEKMLSKEERNQVINKLTMRFSDSPKLDKDYSIDKEGEHQSDSYWIFGSHCPICRENHMSLQGNWWFDNRSKKIYYYLHCTNLKEPGIFIDEVLEAYPENSKPIQELKTQRFTSPIPWNNALIFPNKNIAVEA
ncbi:13406_t:CDS:2, partial [Entrophospora sp. SA101]